MSARKVPPSSEESANKRRRVQEEHEYERENVAPASVTACFNDLNNDCLVNIMSFIPTEDMNTVVMCSKACRKARNNQSLDQMRTASIVCREESTANALFIKLNQGSITLREHPNYTHLKIVGFDTVGADVVDLDNRMRIEPLANVTTLELTKPLNSNGANPEDPHNGRGQSWTFLTLSLYFTHVEKLILDDRNIWFWRFNHLCGNLEHLTRLDWRQGLFDICGYEFVAAENLTELVLDGAGMVCYDWRASTVVLDTERNNRVLNVYSRDIGRGEWQTSYLFM